MGWRSRKSFDSSGLQQEIISVRMALENINRSLEKITPHDGQGRRSGRIYLSLTVVCAILFIGSIWFTIDAFTDAQLGGNAGEVEILLSGEGKNTIGLETMYDAG